MKMPKLVTLTSMDDWNRVISRATLIHGTPEKPKVCRTRDGFIIKWFYPRGGISSDRFMPYAKRFIKHSLQLEQRGIDSVHVQGWFYDSSCGATIVLYPALEGISVREAVTGPMAQAVMDGFVDFVVALHERGVFFRGIHLGNILVSEREDDVLASDAQAAPSLCYSLIDITDCKVRQGKLGRWERLRNLKHLLRNTLDNPIYAAYGVQRFINRYTELTGVEVELSGASMPARASGAVAGVAAGAHLQSSTPTATHAQYADDALLQTIDDRA